MITIIVLLILAGVAIASLTGENGILNRAGQASDNTKRASIIEQAQLAVLNAEVYANGKTSTPAGIKQALTASNLFTTESVNALNESQISDENYKKTAKLTTTDGKFNDITLAEVLGTIATSGGNNGGGGSKRGQITPAPSGATYTAGDEVTFGGEQFFVVSDDGTTVKLLAKYCLSKTADEQCSSSDDYDVYGMTFSSTDYWNGKSGVTYPCDLQTEERLTWMTDAETTANNAILKAQAYGTAKGVKGRLMYYSEADAIVNGSDETMKKILFGTWTDDTAPTEGGIWSWLGAAADTNYVWDVYGGISCLGNDYSNSTDLGVRPVLEIS